MILREQFMKRLPRQISLALACWLVSCAHQSTVTPSTGHIDGDRQVSPEKAAVAANAPIPKPVKPTASLPPPPKVKAAKAQTYSVVVNEVPVKEILFALARESKLNVDIHPAIQGKVTLNAVDQTMPAILERLSKQVDLTYKIEGNVLSIMPDMPVLRTYKIDYVNMSRDTDSFIGADGQISSSGRSTGNNGSSTTTTSGNGANNSSRTAVTSKSESHFWETLEKNVKDILAETDKEILISKSGNNSSSTTTNANTASNNSPQAPNANGQPSANTEEANARLNALAREEVRNEYKTLFAATVISNREAGVMSVRATQKQHEKVQEFLSQVMHSAKRQVLIEATIVEVRLNDSFQAGIDWSRLNNTSNNSGFTFQQSLGPTSSTDASGNVSLSSTALGAATAAGFVAGYLNPLSAIGSISASISLLKQFGTTKVLSSPKLMVLNNQTAILKVVDNLVYFTIQAQQSTVGGTVGGTLSTITTTPNTVPVGVVMSVTPQVSDVGVVNINVRPTVSRVLSFVQDPNPNVTVRSLIPQIQVREMESMLQVRSGNTAVLGGLMQDDIRTNSDKVPGLSNAPVVGKVFNGRNDASAKTELVIFLRPTVVPNASLESEELQSFKQFLPSNQLNQTLDETVE